MALKDSTLFAANLSVKPQMNQHKPRRNFTKSRLVLKAAVFTFVALPTPFVTLVSNKDGRAVSEDTAVIDVPSGRALAYRPAVEYAKPRIQLLYQKGPVKNVRSNTALSVERELTGTIEKSVGGNIPGAAIAIYVQDIPVYRRYAGIDESKPVQLASLTKTFTGVAAMQLVEQGLIGLDEPVSNYGVHISKPEFGHITVRDLLQHTSGISYGSSLPSYAPGIRFQYSNGNYEHLARLIENVSLMSYREYIYQSILKPLGMKDTHVSERNSGASGIASSIRDLNKFSQMLLNGGSYNGRHILFKESIQEMLQPPPFEEIKDVMHYYAHGVRVEARYGKVVSFFHAGVWNGSFSEVKVYPQNQAFVVQLATPVSYRLENLDAMRYQLSVLSERYVKLVSKTPGGLYR